MRRTAMLLTVVAVVLASFAGVALARTIDGNNKDNQLFGTDRADTIHGFGGEDQIFGLDAGDTLSGGRGEDQIFGGDGLDLVRAVDRSEDGVYCGRGRDEVRANPGDKLYNCEQVTRDGPRVGQ